MSDQDSITTIYFVRHAESLTSHKDDRTRPLTDDGMKDRKIVLETLKGKKLDYACRNEQLRHDHFKREEKRERYEILKDALAAYTKKR